MTPCAKIQPRLTAYLDGELADDDGSAVRGHLRECAACRQVARDEAALRDGLRVLAPIDPPPSLWASVQAQLATAEVADAHKPGWRRHAERWIRWARSARWTPTVPQLASAGLVAASAIALVTWHGRGSEEARPARGVAMARPDDRAAVPVSPAPARPATPAPATALADDVTADLIAEPARTTARYDQVVKEVMKLAEEQRTRWSNEERATYDATIAELRGAIDRAGGGRLARRAQGALIRYVQRTLVHTDVVLADGGAR